MPDLRLIGRLGRDKKLQAQMQTILEEAKRATVEKADELAPMANKLAELVCNAVGEWPNTDQDSARVPQSAAFGYAIAAVEHAMGWQRPGLVDARIQSTLAMVGVPEDSQSKFLIQFMVRAGYWVARSGENGANQLIAALSRERATAEPEAAMGGAPSPGRGRTCPFGHEVPAGAAFCPTCGVKP